MPELTDLSYVRALCEKYDFALSKGFGQNFIINPGTPEDRGRQRRGQALWCH